jgi:modification methylase
VHGQVDARPGQGVVKYDHAYSADRANLGRVGQQALLAALAEILVGCHELLRPGGLLVLTARPWRRREQLVDFPGQLACTAEAAGLVPFERNVALLVGLNSDRLVGRPSFFQLDRVRKARGAGPAATDHRPRGRAGVQGGRPRWFTRTEGSATGTRGSGAPRLRHGSAG